MRRDESSFNLCGIKMWNHIDKCCAQPDNLPSKDTHTYAAAGN